MANTPKNINPVIGANIRKERLRMGFTQAALSQRINKSDSCVRMWELGVSEPTNDSLVALAEIFDVSTDYLLGRDTPPPPNNDALDGISAAFSGGLEGLSQEDLDDVAKYIGFLRTRKG